jgi:polysaccharide export outer membrane protein
MAAPHSIKPACRAAHHRSRLLLWIGAVCALGITGCAVGPPRNMPGTVFTPPGAEVPRELAKTSLPMYRVAPPDILLINAIKVVPRAPYRIEPLDLLLIVVSGTLPDQPIQGSFRVESGGTVALGPSYGSVPVAGLTLDEARDAIVRHLSATLRTPEVVISLAEPAAKQQIQGEHLIGPDGTVNLGVYGQVYLSGLTLKEAKQAIEMHLSQYLEAPEVAVDVFSYNSQSYYVITQGLGNSAGDSVVKIPVTGNETVLDALSQVDGLQPFSSTRVWIARPAPDGLAHDQILPVDWHAITQGGSTSTNYQILPGDRVYVAENRLMAFNGLVLNLTQPFERAFGFTLLGVQTIQGINRFPRGFGQGIGGNNFGTGFF